MSCSTFSAPGRLAEKVMRALASRTIRFIVRGVSCSGALQGLKRSEFSLPAALLEENFWSLGVFAEAAAEIADKFRSERLENETIFLFDEGHLRTLVNGVFAAKLCGDDELAFGGDGGDFGLHGGSRGRIRDKYNGSVDVSQLDIWLTSWNWYPGRTEKKAVASEGRLEPRRKRDFSHPQADPSQERREGRNRPAPFEMTEGKGWSEGRASLK